MTDRLHDCLRCGKEDSETINGCDLCFECGQAEPEARWRVEVLCAGGWKILARFANEADAWEYGKQALQARVYFDYGFRAELRDGVWSKRKSKDRSGGK